MFFCAGDIEAWGRGIERTLQFTEQTNIMHPNFNTMMEIYEQSCILMRITQKEITELTETFKTNTYVTSS